MVFVRYRILGTTQALRTDGTLVPVGGARLRALLVVLALRPGRTVSAAVLVDEVWGADPPADAPGALQALVGRLRRALGADAVGSDEGGYRLRAAADDVDLHRFERLAGEGSRALADGDPGKAAVILDDALALWRGPALADLPDRTAESSRWESRRLDARRARLTAALALGHAEQSLPDLTALCDTHPLDEPLQLLRLRALRDAGRTAEALAGYEAVRQLLADRLGTDPGPELRSLHAQLLRGAPDRHDAEPEFGSVSVPDSGSGSGSRSLSASRERSAPLGNLRARLTSFVGRDTDLAAIRGDLAAARLVTLLGPGGAGKTRLSQEAAESVAASLPDGVWLAELAPVDDPEAVPEAVLTALGARETVLRGAGAEELRVVTERHDDPLVRLTEHCAKRRMLIVLDNCEHVVDAAARLVEQLLERCPGLTVLATSREPLGVPGELLRPVEPLPEPYALRLLADRGAAARPGFRVEDDPEAAAEICRRLDGLPLAIELAAARLRMLTPRQIADRLDNRFRLLTSGSRTVLPRQQTLRAVVDWSWDLLDEDERDVLRRLSVFAGGCDLAAAEAVCGPAALEALGSLVDKSLVVAAPSGKGKDEGRDEREGDGNANANANGEGNGESRGESAMRYRLLETVAEYAGQRLDACGERAATERAHLTYYREFARTTDPLLRGPGQREAIDLFQLESENTRAALQHAIAEGDEQEALCLVLSLAWYWQIRDLRLVTRNWTRETIALGPDPFAPPVERAVPLYESCTANPPPMRADVLAEARRGVHLLHLSCMEQEIESWQTPEADAKMRAVAETYEPGFPQVCRNPGYLWFFAVLLTGDMDRLHQVVDASVEACRELGYGWELAVALQMRANILANRADWAGDATRDADESLELFVRLGDAWGAAEALSARGEAHERRGEYQLAATDYETAITHAERLGARAQAAVLGSRLGGVLIDAGESERGERLLRDVLERGDGTHNEALPAARLFLAVWFGRSDRVADAREQLRRLRDDFGALRFVVFDGYVLGVESWLDSKEGLYDEAVRKIRGALERAKDPLTHMISPHMPSAHLATAAVALAGVDGGRRAPDAARCLGAADGLLPPGHFRVVMEREIRAQAEAAVREVLDDTAYDTAYAEGGGLSFEEATALV
ncbi:putative ATPase/DNA-binding SARP family transcriptional activator/tetratricopeptide (TPR) repeat protein [Streptomyces aurantiacus]|uniref:AfsR/SARP family transcriptional regulator n=1 Tax=Streptomyces aurantiacus TaxID=47760 RepID=UPI0027904A5A|nr:BTAD domain-containing putative transcriptional regulator [Streptomyces aurantiacus]MDQ0777695.1 putative ATPase/DNA-binding SARP family transcriptional activator/tetratricopeptide (TPR) repeat protein [Streptomyces aurantiacus]